MIGGDEWRSEALVSSTDYVTVFEREIKEPTDKIIVGVINNYAGINLDSLEYRVFIRITRTGDYFRLPADNENGLVWPPWDLALHKGECDLGRINNWGVRSLLIDAKRPGPDPIPMGIEVKCLYNEME